MRKTIKITKEKLEQFSIRLEEKKFITNLNKNNRYKPENIINENFNSPHKPLDFRNLNSFRKMNYHQFKMFPPFPIHF